MIAREQWKSLLHLTPDYFRYPDQMVFDVVYGLDLAISSVGAKPINLSDYRPGDPRQHGLGRAVDVCWPDSDPLSVWQKLLALKVFSGLGIYLNDQGVVSFHVDTRLDRIPDNPALWGDFITYPYNPDTKTHVRADQYTTADAVIEVLKKKSVTLIGVLVICGFVLYRMLRD